MCDVYYTFEVKWMECEIIVNASRKPNATKYIPILSLTLRKLTHLIAKADLLLQGVDLLQEFDLFGVNVFKKT